MSKASKIIIFIGIGLLLLGTSLFLIIGFSNNFEFSSTDNKVVNTYDITDEFNKINIDIDTADLEFIASEAGTKVECVETEHIKHTVSVVDQTLTITSSNDKHWYFFSLFNVKITVKVYMPSGMYESLNILTDTGDVTIPSDFSFKNANIKCTTGDVDFKSNVEEALNVKVSTGKIRISSLTTNDLEARASTGKVFLTDLAVANSIKVNTTTGDTNLNNVTAKNINLEADTGDMLLTNVSTEAIELRTTTGKHILTNVVATGDFKVNASTGKVKFDSCDAASFKIETSTGDVTGTFLTAKIFYVDTSTGDVDVPKSVEGGLCEISTSTGDVKITIK